MANRHSSKRNGKGATTSSKKVINRRPSAVPENSPVGRSERTLKQNNGSSVHWTPCEQALLKELIIKYAPEKIVKRYANVVVMMPTKTLSDSALCYRWMTEKENRKQIRDTNNSSMMHKNNKKKETGKQMNYNSNSSRRNKHKKGKAAYQQVKPSSHAANHSNGLHHAQSSISIETDEDLDDDISYKAIGGTAVQLLEQNEQALNQLMANVSAFNPQENSYLQSQMRDNLGALLYESVCDKLEMNQSVRELYDFPIIEEILNLSLDK